MEENKILEAINGLASRMDKKMDSMEKRMDKKMDSMEKRMNKRMDGMDKKIDIIIEEQVAMKQEQAIMKQDIQEIKQEQAVMKQDIQEVKAKQITMEKRMDHRFQEAYNAIGRLVNSTEKLFAKFDDQNQKEHQEFRDAINL